MININDLPKVELHCHLDGILNSHMLQDILWEDPAFPVDPTALAQAYPVNNYESFWRWWEAVDPLRSTSINRMRPILQRYVTHLKAQNVRYAEIMISSRQLINDIPQQGLEELQQFCAWAKELQTDDFQLSFLMSLARNVPIEWIAAVVDPILSLHEQGIIVGVVLASVEQGYPVKPLHTIFAQFQEAGLGIEIHAGEWVGPESVWDALTYGYPNRIGHGVNLFQDPKLIALCQEKQIHIEFCPTSNIKTGSIAGIHEHPIHHALELGLNFSINTDDPGIFECSMNSEYALVANAFGLGESDFQQIYRNSLAARF